MPPRYLTSWEGHSDLDCHWVLESGMSKVAREWWDVERELRYPGYLDEDFPLYDKKSNRLSTPPSTRTFLSEIPCLESKDPGHSPKLLSLMRFVTSNDFDSWNFLTAYHSGNLDERFFQSLPATSPTDDKAVEAPLSSGTNKATYLALLLKMRLKTQTKERRNS